MKKVLILILCVSMMVGLTACSNANKEKDNDDKPKETKVSQETEETEEKEVEEKDTKEIELEETEENNEKSNSELSRTHTEPVTKDLVLYVDIPNDYMPIEQGYVQMFNVGRDKSISLVTDRKYEPSSLQDAHDAVFEEYIQGFQNYARIDTLTVEKEEVVEINGMEMYHFEGELNCSYNDVEYDLYCTGYSFIMDDIPCMLIGTVLEDEQPQEMIDEVKMYTDAMIQTVREAE